MARRLKKSYRFALKSATLITIGTTLLMIAFFYFSPNIWWLIFFALLTFGFSFFVLQYRVEKFIYKRIKKIYNDVALLQNTDFENRTITTDIRALSEEISRFAHDKKVEIESLKIREDYRKEYIGNISHELNTPLFTVQSYILTLLDGAVENKTVRKSTYYEPLKV
ncbi:Sensor protein [Capnocytophaga canimorsus Cc5]|uniref:histidine kinase n=1 Tax=Capnocytophaga canimorsus (strain 5) TaxID=860228 RepID=F9YSB9_CAPCC|nr:Sensor protein [Capnocytophaga canimorsus Cc5]